MKKATFIDLSSIAHPIWHTSQGDANPNATSIRTVEAVRRFAGNEPNVVVCCDLGRSFRKDVDAEYKAQRPPTDAALGHQINLAIETLKIDGFPVWSCSGFEADDVIASAVALALAYVDTKTEQVPAFDAIEVLSSDKDLLQLVDVRVTVRSIASGKSYDPAGVAEKLGVNPWQVVDWLSLVGDTADNIRGAKGVGPKRAAELLSKYGNLDDMFAALTDHGTDFTPALATALREFQPRLALVRELVTLCKSVPLPTFGEIFRERIPEDAVFSAEDAQPPADEPATPPPTVPAPLQFHPKAFETTIPMPAALSHIHPPGAPQVESPSTMQAGAPTPAATAGTGTTAATATVQPLTSPVVPPAPVKGPEQAIPASQAVAVIDQPAQAPVEWRQQLEPRSMQQAAWIAEQLFKSRLFSAYGTPQGVLSTVLAGREFGLQAMASLRGFHIIEGRPSMSADLIRALVLKSGLAEYFRCSERTPTRATFLAKRKGEPEIALSFTIEEARAAWKKDDRAFAASGYGTNPADMLVARAGSKLARLVFPDVVFGLYEPSELGVEVVE